MTREEALLIGRKEGANKALDELVQSLEEIDACEFASFTLCLIKEKVEEVKKLNESRENL